MGFYDGFCFLRKKGFQVIPDAFLFTPMKARVVYSSQSDFCYDIELSDRLSDAEKIESFIHECIHFGENYRRFVGHMQELPSAEYERIEFTITEEARYLSQHHHRLVAFLSSRLAKMK